MKDIKKMEEKAKKIRREILIMTTKAGSGHPGGSMSAADLVVALYYGKMRINPKNPKSEDRDRFVLSKGHCSPLMYAVLADLGFFPEPELKNFRKLGSILQGHIDIKVPGIEMSAGSLGQGLSFANGIALGARLDNKKFKIYTMLGDGEMQEGQIWEAAMASSHYNLDNVCAILDNNGLQIDGPNKEVMNVEPVKEKFEAFGWNTIEIDGHNYKQIFEALSEADKVKGKPTIIIAHTIKGKGVSFMENNVEFHGKALTEEQLKQALKELE